MSTESTAKSTTEVASDLPRYSHGYASPERALEAHWIDYNGHLNMAYYLVLFEEGAEAFWQPMGLGDAYRDRTGHTTYTASAKIDYIKEVSSTAHVHVHTVLRDVGPKKFLIWQGLYTSDGTLRATCETLTLHVDQTGEAPKVAPFAPEMLLALQKTMDAHARFEPPHATGRPVQMQRG